jgi:DNA invertase Pin-like site-specific DNA recombinase
MSSVQHLSAQGFEMTANTTKFVAYYRVSTDRQGQSGLGLDAQRAAVAKHIGTAELVAEFTEVESGRKNDREQLAAALATAKRTKSMLVIAKLDRLARNVHFISGLLESNVPFVCADMPEADRTFLQMMAVFAEWEARKISERTKAALAQVKAQGRTLGCPTPEIGSAAGIARIQAKADAYAQRVGPVVRDIMNRCGANTLRDIAAELTMRGIETPRGNTDWRASQVSNLLKRI